MFEQKKGIFFEEFALFNRSSVGYVPGRDQTGDKIVKLLLIKQFSTENVKKSNPMVVNSHWIFNFPI